MKDASLDLQNVVRDHFTNSDIGRIGGVGDFSFANYPSNSMKEISIVTAEGLHGSSFGILSLNDESMALIAVFSEDESTVREMIFSKNYENEDGSVDTKLFDIKGNLTHYFTTTNDTVIHHSVSSTSRTSSWWSDTGDCVAEASTPFKDGLLDLAFNAAATYATGGWYGVVLVGACGILAL